MPKTTRQEIEKNTIEVMHQVRHNRNTVDKIIDKMSEYDYLAGDVQGYVVNTENEIFKLDPRTICLLLECTFEVTNIPMAYPKHYYTEPEIKTSRQFTGDLLRKDRVELPLTLHNVRRIAHNMYVAIMSTIEINNWQNSLLLNYNFDTQREPTVEMFNGQIIFEPTVYPENIREMTELLKLRKLVTSDPIVINAGVKTSDSDMGEYIYSEENETLFINNCKLDIIDGYHRCRAIQNAMSLDNTIDTKFIVVFTNFTVKECQDLLEQKSKATPLSSKRIDEFKSNDFVNEVVERLKKDSELKGRVMASGVRKYDNRFLVTHDILVDAIKMNFKIENKSQVIDISEQLSDFFDYLISVFEYEFIKNVNETREKSFFNHDFMFYGFITLAQRMFDNGIKVRKIRNILNQIDFHKENELWKNIKLIDKNGEIADIEKVKKIIVKFFNTLDLEEGVLSE